MPVCSSLWHRPLGGSQLCLYLGYLLRAVLHGTLALLTAAQQLEQFNAIHDPPVAVLRIPNPSYLALQLAWFHSGDIKGKGRIFTAIEVHFNDTEKWCWWNIFLLNYLDSDFRENCTESDMHIGAHHSKKYYNTCSFQRNNTLPESSTSLQWVLYNIPHLHFSYFIYCLLEMISVTTEEMAPGSRFWIFYHPTVMGVLNKSCNCIWLADKIML